MYKNVCIDWHTQTHTKCIEPVPYKMEHHSRVSKCLYKIENDFHFETVFVYATGDSTFKCYTFYDVKNQK